MNTTRSNWRTLAHVPAGNIHLDENIPFGETCTVRVIATAHGGSARTLVRCVFSGITAHVHPCAVH